MRKRQKKKIASRQENYMQKWTVRYVNRLINLAMMTHRECRNRISSVKEYIEEIGIQNIRF